MDSDKWPAFLGGLVLGVLVTLGVGGSFGWQKYRQAQAEAEQARAEAAEIEEKTRDRLLNSPDVNDLPVLDRYDRILRNLRPKLHDLANVLDRDNPIPPRDAAERLRDLADYWK